MPSHLRSSLWAWVAGRIHTQDDLFQIERVLQIELVDLKYGIDVAIGQLQARAVDDSDFFLKLVDFLLSLLDVHAVPQMDPQFNDRLADQAALLQMTVLLNQTGSLWKVAPVVGGRFGLERRVPPVVEAAAKQAMNSEDKAAQHLRLAWHAVYGRHPDPGKGYGEAIKAMEAAAIPVVLPNTTVGTLGKVIAALRDKPAKWAVGLKHPEPERQVQVLADMMDLIWKGQTGRHGDPDPDTPISVSQEQAEAAVHLAVTVVQWFTTGVVASR